MVEVKDVAKAILTFESMTHKKLQKLCYYVQAWHLALYDKPLMDTKFEAWVHGPVCPELYHKYKGCGWDGIEKQTNMPSVIADNEELVELFTQVFRIYGDLDGDQLELLTHEELPWRKARAELPAWMASNREIDDNVIKDFYKEQLRSDNYA